MISNNVKIFDLLGGTAPQSGLAQTPTETGLSEESGQAFDILLGQIASVATPQIPEILAGNSEFEAGSPDSMIEMLNPVNNEMAGDEATELTIVKTEKSLGKPLLDLMGFVNVENGGELKAVDSKMNPKEPHQKFSGLESKADNLQNHSNEMPMVNIDKFPSGVFKSGSVDILPKISDDIFAKLNLEEIQIKSDTYTGGKIENSQPMSAELQSTLKTENVKIGTELSAKSAESSAKIISDLVSAEPSFESDGETFNSQLNSKEISKSPDSGKSEKQMFDVQGVDSALLDDNSNIIAKTAPNTNLDSKTFGIKESVQNTADLKSTHSVKIVIPETIKLTGDQKSHSIMIKIEPEHLGPARLDLHVKNDVLSARLTVETAAAKSTIENSINSLKEQLAKCDIEVDQIEVNVRGETNYNQLFEKQPQWQKFGSANQFRFSGSELLEKFIPSNEIITGGMLQYVGSNGVNILA